MKPCPPAEYLAPRATSAWPPLPDYRRLPIDSDAHYRTQLDWLRFGCQRAAMCGVPAGRVVTTWPAERLLDGAAGHAA